MRDVISLGALGMICDPSRAAALGQLDGFIRVAGLYARDRNHVKSGHPSVSRLAPAIRHRLITEDEVVSAVLRVQPFGRVEKFIQEVYWRRYWKSWLALRPQIWSDYLNTLAEIPQDPLVRLIEISQSGNAVIDHFANELVTTGYLHNHARMWFAAWWVHEARLPWQCGAAFFFRYLLDGDPASNTLSWRWVAGHQTIGKTYLARRANLEKYLAPDLLNSMATGLTAFEHPHALLPESSAKPEITGNNAPIESLSSSTATGLWIHEEDLSVETSPLGLQAFSAIIVTGDVETWSCHRFPKAKQQWLADALQDAAARAELRWNAPVLLETRQSNTDALLRWAKTNQLNEVAAIRPEIGPLHDSLTPLRAALSQAGIRLVLIERPEDLSIRNFATGGFFQFWERIRKNLFATHTRGDSSKPQQLSFEFPR
ncbi:MAG: DNA photolyase [Gloeobacteraceae cyanobacterium ES-bin-144]|nr:DNA photolyase [Verrucomicrobiales bacterium]